MEKTLRVEVVFARPDQQVIKTVELAAGATLEQAIRLSGVLEQFPEINLARMAVGIFGLQAKLDDLVADGDRVELYRPLQVDPKELRRRRAKARRRL